MTFSSFRYLVKQGWHNMIANRLMSFASFGVLTACLVITGAALLLSVNLNSYMTYLGSQTAVEAFLEDTVDSLRAMRWRRLLKPCPSNRNIYMFPKSRP